MRFKVGDRVKLWFGHTGAGATGRVVGLLDSVTGWVRVRWDDGGACWSCSQDILDPA